MALRFLIDENLARGLTRIAHAHGYEAVYVPHVGLQGLPDHELLDRALMDEWVLVTNNALDFLKLVSRDPHRHPSHAGLVLVLTQVSPPVQARLFEAALAFLAGRTDLIDLVVHVDVDDATRGRLDPHRELSPAEWSDIADRVAPVVRIEPFPPG